MIKEMIKKIEIAIDIEIDIEIVQCILLAVIPIANYLITNRFAMNNPNYIILKINNIMKLEKVEDLPLTQKQYESLRLFYDIFNRIKNNHTTINFDRLQYITISDWIPTSVSYYALNLNNKHLELFSNDGFSGVIAHELGHVADLSLTQHMALSLLQWCCAVSDMVLRSLLIVSFVTFLYSLICNGRIFEPKNYKEIGKMVAFCLLLNMIASFISKQYEYSADHHAAVFLDDAKLITQGLIEIDESQHNSVLAEAWGTFFGTHPSFANRVNALKNDFKHHYINC